MFCKHSRAIAQTDRYRGALVLGRGKDGGIRGGGGRRVFGGDERAKNDENRGLAQRGTQQEVGESEEEG